MPDKLKSPMLNIKELKGNMAEYLLYSCLQYVEGHLEQDRKPRSHKRKDGNIWLYKN